MVKGKTRKALMIGLSHDFMRGVEIGAIQLYIVRRETIMDYAVLTENRDLVIMLCEESNYDYIIEPSPVEGFSLCTLIPRVPETSAPESPVLKAAHLKVVK